MKKIIVLFLLYSTIATNAQTDTLGIGFIEPADSTALGIPDGELASKKIGADGGSIISGDGRIELIFPAGALASTTTISIQPTTNPLSNGAGKAYWFEPSGTQFKKPVQFIFHYNDEEAETCPPEIMGMALQDKKGKWSYMDYEDWDSAGKTLKGYIYHFTGATSVYQIWMAMSRTELRVNQSATIDFVSYLDEGEAVFFAVNQKLTWKVNNDENGNEIVGRITPMSARVGKKVKITSAVYTAPNILPVSDAVNIKVELYVSKGKRRNILRTFKKKVTIYDLYKIQVVHEFTLESAMGSKLVDSASAIVWVYHHKIRLSDIQNYAPIVLKEGSKVGCEEKISTDGQLGTIHFTEAVSKLEITHYPPEIYFEFPQFTIPMVKVRYVFRRVGVSTETVSLSALSLPEEINFIANGQTQRYNVTLGNHSTYKLIVTPNRPVKPK